VRFAHDCALLTSTLTFGAKNFMKPIQAVAWFVCAGVAASLIGSQHAQARPLYSALMLYQYNLRDDAVSRREGCQYCHTDRIGSDSWNPFGSLLRDQFFGEGEGKIQVALYLALAANKDSDKDGYTDAQEVYAKTLPGVSASRPSRPAKEIQAALEAAGGVDELFSPKTPGVTTDPVTAPPPPPAPPPATVTPPPPPSPATPPQANVTPPAPSASPPLIWANFVNGGSNLQNGSITSTGYAERTGDVSVERPVMNNNFISVGYVLTKTNGSGFGGAGLVFNAPNNRPVNMSAYTKLRLKMQATSTSRIRLRLGGNNRATLINGCYPIRYNTITDKLESYTFELNTFFSDSYCGSNEKTSAETLLALAYVEVVDAEMPVSGQKRGQISVADIEFLK
jgi:hypothetical protein